MKDGRLKQQWDDFYRKVVPKDAPAVQIQEMRRSFYAGAEAMMRVSLNVAELSEDSAETELQMVEDELKQFAFDVKAGKA